MREEIWRPYLSESTDVDDGMIKEEFDNTFIDVSSAYLKSLGRANNFKYHEYWLCRDLKNEDIATVKIDWI